MTGETRTERAGAEWRVAVGGDETTAVYEPAGADARTVFVCAHGAGGNMTDRGMLRVTRALRERGLPIVRFNFFYTAKRSSRPDPMAVLKQCFAAVVDRVRAELGPHRLIIGGRSMGGRAASMMAADGFDCAGLLLLAYPLHPAGRPDQLRDAHLPAIRVPVLCLNGTRDALCTRELMEKALQRVTAPWTMRWLEGADHSFHVLKRSGRTDEDVMKEIADATEAWVAGL